MPFLSTNRITALLVLFLLKELQWGWGIYAQRQTSPVFLTKATEATLIREGDILRHQHFWRDPIKHMLIEKIWITPNDLMVWGQGFHTQEVFSDPKWEVSHKSKNSRQYFFAKKKLE